MNATIEKRLLLVWAILSAISLSQLSLGSFGGEALLVPDAVITFGVIAMALIKVRIIAREFMEVRHAPVLLCRLVDIWLLVTALLLLGIYSVGMAVSTGSI